MDSVSEENCELFPISTVCERTGVNPVTLRAWERRHDLVQPRRSERGRRLYSEQDIETVNRICKLVEKGIPVGQVSQVLRQEINEGAGQEKKTQDMWSGYLLRMLGAISVFDERSLQAIYDQVLSLHPVDVVTERLIVPLLHRLGERWATGKGSVAEEHFFRVFIRNKIGARIHHRVPGASGPRMLVACVPGEEHELGSLLFCLYALERDYRVINLGANTPLFDIPKAVERSKSRAVVLCASSSSAFEENGAGLPGLTALTAELTVPVFLGGRLLERIQEKIQQTGAIYIGESFAEGMALIESRLPVAN